MIGNKERGVCSVMEDFNHVLSECRAGDKWVVRCISSDADYSMTIEFVGEENSAGRNLCVMRVSFGPGAAGRPENMIVHIDWATLFPVKIESVCDHIGIPVTVVTTYEDHFPGVLPYPLEMGKEFDVIQTETTTYSMDGEIPVEIETTTKTLTCKVEAIEEISVPAGTFKCVKVTKYDQDGSALGTSWKSEEVGCAVDVKYIDHRNGETCELMSYPRSRVR